MVSEAKFWLNKFLSLTSPIKERICDVLRHLPKQRTEAKYWCRFTTFNKRQIRGAMERQIRGAMRL